MNKRVLLVSLFTLLLVSLPGEPLLTDSQRELFQELEAQYAAAPDDFDVVYDAGMNYMWLTLSGNLSFQEKAEFYLVKAFELDPGHKDLSRSLGRFYNMRMVELDFSKADKQVEVYTAFLEGKPVEELDDSEFVAWSFYQMARAIRFNEEGHPFKALRSIKDLETNIRDRVEKQPENVEFRALGGNFALFLAGNVPSKQRRRVREGIAYFEFVRDNWEDMRPGAGNTFLCPNTYQNFMFELADAYLVDRQVDEAREIFSELSEVTGTVTRPKEIMAALSMERTVNAEWYRGNKKLMPPWPSDVGNCVVCHSYDTDFPMDSLFVRESFDISSVLSQAVGNPLFE